MVDEPLEFRIIQSLQTALRSISMANGYHYDFVNLAVKLDPDQDVESLIGEDQLRPYLILAISPGEFEYFPAKQVRLFMPFVIHAVSNSDPEDDDDRLRVFLRLCADIETAIAVDITLGALVTDTRIFEREMHEMAGQLIWAMVKGEIREHRTYGEPNG